MLKGYKAIHNRGLRVLFFICLFALLPTGYVTAGQTYSVGVLTVGDVRVRAMDGFMQEMNKLQKQNDVNIDFYVMNAKNDRDALPDMAMKLVARKPDLAIAAGGVEADALRSTTAENKIPVVFLVVSSSVARGLVKSLPHPGGNMTGIDTNDTVLTEKRLWYITKMFPEAKNILSLNVPSIKPSADSVNLAKERAPQLGLEMQVVDVETIDEIKTATAAIKRDAVDAVLLNPCAPVSKALKSILLPMSLKQKIPVFGNSEGHVLNGAVASYGPSRFGIGKQGAHIAWKVLQGENPSVLPVEAPRDFELVINRHMLARLGLNLPDRIYTIAHKVVDIEM